MNHLFHTAFHVIYSDTHPSPSFHTSRRRCNVSSSPRFRMKLPYPITASCSWKTNIQVINIQNPFLQKLYNYILLIQDQHKQILTKRLHTRASTSHVSPTCSSDISTRRHALQSTFPARPQPRQTGFPSRDQQRLYIGFFTLLRHPKWSISQIQESASVKKRNWVFLLKTSVDDKQNLIAWLYIAMRRALLEGAVQVFLKLQERNQNNCNSRTYHIWSVTRKEFERFAKASFL